MKVVINRCYGGFSLSRKAVLRARELSENPLWGGATIIGDTYESGEPLTHDYGFVHEVSRSDPLLVRVIEELGSEASNRHAYLTVIEVPDDALWTIKEHDGIEWVAENHRTWN